jgi:hypothetical protein
MHIRNLNVINFIISQKVGITLLQEKEYEYTVQCIQKVAVHLQKVLEVMSTNVCTGLNLN